MFDNILYDMTIYEYKSKFISTQKWFQFHHMLQKLLKLCVPRFPLWSIVLNKIYLQPSQVWASKKVIIHIKSPSICKLNIRKACCKKYIYQENLKPQCSTKQEMAGKYNQSIYSTIKKIGKMITFSVCTRETIWRRR